MQPRREYSRRGRRDRSRASRRFVWEVVGTEPQLPHFSPGGGIVGGISGVLEKDLREPSRRVALAKLWHRARWPPRRLLASLPGRSSWHSLISLVSPLRSPEVNQRSRTWRLRLPATFSGKTTKRNRERLSLLVASGAAQMRRRSAHKSIALSRATRSATFKVGCSTSTIPRSPSLTGRAAARARVPPEWSGA